MKYLKSVGTLAIVSFMFVMFVAGMVQAADKTINLEIDELKFALDRNESPYARAIVTDEFELDGVKYTKSVAVMAFGEGNLLEDFKKGDTLHGIVEVTEYQGRINYRLLSVIETIASIPEQ